MKTINPTKSFKLYEETLPAKLERAQDRYIRFVHRHRSAFIGAAVGAFLVTGYAVVSNYDYEDQLRIEQEYRRTAEERALAISQWHRENTVDIRIIGSPERVQTIAGQIAALPLLSSPVKP